MLIYAIALGKGECRTGFGKYKDEVSSSSHVIIRVQMKTCLWVKYLQPVSTRLDGIT